MKLITTLAIGAALLLSACTSTTFISTWKSPEARTFQASGQKVAAVFIGKDEAQRRVAEDTLVRQINARGAQGIATLRTLLPEIARFRSLARSMYAAGAGEMVRQLAAYLERAMQAGELRRDDPQFAAELLLGMLTGQDRIKGLFCVLPRADPDNRHTQRIVDCFLRAYSP